MPNNSSKNAAKPPVISVCIPTYNRIHFLRQLINSIIATVNGLGGKVEVVISDNCSTDGTRQFLDGLENNDYVCRNHNETNLGPLKNGAKCLELANGDYIWFVGDDDIITPTGLLHALKRIEEYPQIDYFLVNTIPLGNSNRKDIETICKDSLYINNYKTKFDSKLDRYVESFNEFIDPEFDPLFLGAMMCNIIRRSIWAEGITTIDLNAKTGTLHGTYCTISILARHMPGKASYYIGFPCTLAFWGHQPWQSYLPIIDAYTVYAMLDEYEKFGVEQWRIEKCQRFSHKKGAKAILKLNLIVNTPGRYLFSTKNFLIRYWRHKELWMGFIKGIFSALFNVIKRLFDNIVPNKAW